MKKALIIVFAVQVAALLVGLGLWLGGRNQPLQAVAAQPRQVEPIATESPAPAIPRARYRPSLAPATDGDPEPAADFASELQESAVESAIPEEFAPTSPSLASPAPRATGVRSVARKSVERGVSGMIDGLFGRAQEKVLGTRGATGPGAAVATAADEPTEEGMESSSVVSDKDVEASPEEPAPEVRAGKTPSSSSATSRLGLLGRGALRIALNRTTTQAKVGDTPSPTPRVATTVAPNPSKRDTSALHRARASAAKLTMRVPGRRH